MVKKGVTLVELIIVVALVGIVLGVTQTYFLKGFDFLNINQARLETQRDARTCINMIRTELQKASATSIIIDRENSSQPPWSLLEFVNMDNERIRFYQSGTDLYMNNITDGNLKLIAENVRQATFSYPRFQDWEVISISICLEKEPKYDKKISFIMSAEKVRIMNE